MVGYVPCGEAFLLGEDETTLYGNRQLALEAGGLPEDYVIERIAEGAWEGKMMNLCMLEVWIASSLLRSEKESSHYV